MDKRARRSTRKRRRSPRWRFLDELGEFEPDPVSVELSRIVHTGDFVFLARVAWYERSLADIVARFGGGLYQIVVRYRGRVRGTRVFEIWGPTIDDRI